jgi:hypothetical protein
MQAIIDTIRPHIPEIADYTLKHRARLVKPMLSYDNCAIALSFLPAAGEPCSSAKDRLMSDDDYSYHHLRRDIHSLCVEAGAPVQSRYIVPSSHLTIGRFIDASDFSAEDGSTDTEKMQTWISKIDEINKWLETEYWPKKGQIKEGGEWIVGEEKGLDCRIGTLWYGGGTTVNLGKGF